MTGPTDREAAIREAVRTITAKSSIRDLDTSSIIFLLDQLDAARERIEELGVEIASLILVKGLAERDADAVRRERDDAREERDRVLSGDWTADELRKFVWCGGELTSARKVIEAARPALKELDLAYREHWKEPPEVWPEPEALRAALASHDAAYPPQEPSP